ncbi:DUF6449 domain-containing protein [Paenibacillus sp. BR2-3]|uniref:DUF6449 domain-containing protein n=1 Tax=Paenibacillus sp. BR2-3 TaxID=3048494 RepID=UPI003977BA97
MTFSRFFFNRGLMRQNFRQHGWIGIIYTLGLLFALPMQMVLGNDPYSEPRVVHNLFQIGDSIQQLFIISVPIAAGLFLFRYLQAKPAADLLHSIPLRRSHLLTANMASGLLLLLLPVWLTAAVTACLLPWNGNMYIFTGADLWSWTIALSIITVFLFSFSVFVGICTGQTLLQGIVTYTLLILPDALSHLLRFHFSLYLYGYSYQYSVSNSNESWSPFIRIMNPSLPYSSGELVIYGAISVLCIGMSYLLYSKRQVEKAGQAISFTYFNPLFKAGVMLCAMLVAGNYFAEMKRAQVGWAFAGYIIGAIIGYIAAEMIIRKTWQIMKRTMTIEFAVYGGILGLLLFIPVSGLTGYEARVPSADRIDSVYVGSYYRMYQQDDSMRVSGNTAFTRANPLSSDKEFIAAVRRLHLTVAAIRPENKLRSSYEDDYSAYKNLSIAYQLDNGRLLTREYLVPLAGFEPELKAVMEMESYKRAEYTLSELDKNIDRIQLRNRDKEVTIADPEEILEFKAILMKEIMNLSYEDQTDNKSALASIQTMISMDDKPNVPFFNYSWRSSYHELGKWLETKGYAEKVLTTAKDVLSAEIVKQANSGSEEANNRFYNPDDYFQLAKEGNRMVEITDKEKIDALLDERRDTNLRSGTYLVMLKFKTGYPEYITFKESELTPALKLIMP